MLFDYLNQMLMLALFCISNLKNDVVWFFKSMLKNKKKQFLLNNADHIGLIYYAW